jgi:uncharacterized peroxidase-related enzyme
VTDIIGFLAEPDMTPEAQRTFDEDLDEFGYVMNVTRLWAYQPGTAEALFALQRQATAEDPLSFRQKAILVAACAAAFGDSYCSLVWAGRLAGTSDGDATTAAAVLRGTDDGLSASERAMARWARTIARDPNATTADDVQALRDAGFTDRQIFAMTVFIALRLAFAMVNDALGVQPDTALRTALPQAILDTVTTGRPIQPDTAHDHAAAPR